MITKPCLIVKLDHCDLQKIYDRALDAIKNTSNKAIDIHLFPIYCTLEAFKDFVNKEDNYLQLEQPERQPYNPDSFD